MTIEETVADYVASWSAQDTGAREVLLERVWAEDATYQDPSADVAGRAALVAHIGGFHQAMPGAQLEMTSGVSHHNGNVFFGWKLITADGATVIEGVDFGTIGPDGKLAKIVGFFGPPGA